MNFSIPTGQQLNYHLHGDPHRRASALSDIILGGQDGLVNVLGVILGVAAATADAQIVLVPAWPRPLPSRSRWAR